MFLRQKPTAEQLSMYLTPGELSALFPLSRDVLHSVFTHERIALKIGFDAAFFDYSWTAACCDGRLDIVMYLHENNHPGCTAEAMDLAIWNGHLVVAQWLHANRQEGCSGNAMEKAAEFGHLELVQLLHSIGKTNTTNAFDRAARNGHLHILQWMRANGLDWCTLWATNWAAEHGHLAVLHWLHENQYEQGSCTAMDYAAENGHLAVLQFLRSIGYWFSDDACYYASENGHLAVVCWLYENFDFNCNYFCRKSMLKGKKRSIGYAIKNATEHQHMDVVQFLLQQKALLQ
jgi:hypothetical protein